MATKQSSSSKIMVPQARAAMNKFKMEAANEVGVDLKKGYNGSMTTREAGSIGGQMVKHVCPVRTLVIERPNRRAAGHAEDPLHILLRGFVLLPHKRAGLHLFKRGIVHGLAPFV